jgi:putative transposase
MPRPPRVQFPGAIYHVTSRGVRKTDIFNDARDRLRLQRIFGEVVQRLDWRCHSYCLMSNHFHLLVETPQPNISRGMQRLNGVYAQWFNWRHGFEGHVFERRFRSVLVEGQAHLLELTRYIVLNPIRAGLCHHPSEWRWSSYAETIGVRDRPEFLQTAWLLSLFSPVPKRARGLYADFVAAAEPAPFGRVLGSDPRSRPDQPYPYTPGNRSASRLTSSAAGRPTTFR